MKSIKRIGTPIPNNIQIFWEGAGWYYNMNNWKYSCDQNGDTETEHRRYFESEEIVKKLFSTVIPTKKKALP